MARDSTAYILISFLFEITLEHIMQSVGTPICAYTVAAMLPKTQKRCEVGDGLIQDEQIRWIR